MRARPPLLAAHRPSPSLSPDRTSFPAFDNLKSYHPPLGLLPITGFESDNHTASIDLGHQSVIVRQGR
jgi:hypothetical protein